MNNQQANDVLHGDVQMNWKELIVQWVNVVLNKLTGKQLTKIILVLIWTSAWASMVVFLIAIGEGGLIEHLLPPLPIFW